MACNSEAQKTNISVAEFEKVITEQKVQLLDVRTAEEYESGYIKNSLQADWNNEDQFKQRVKALDKSIPVYTYCLSGARSGAAVRWLNENGYKAYNMEGGIKSWNKANKPLVQNIKVPQMTMAAFLQQIPSDKTVLVDIGAKWCPPCKAMDVVLKELEQTHGTQFLLVKIDGGAQTDLVKEMNIEEFPTFIIYKEGKPVWKKEGLVEKQEFIKQF
ncbi:MAG TPA: thioredoxin domain-containing protein [Ferruginibacter sp.]|nr:thioredoxin domain-containing protein [Ferruginibacter sp.]